MCVCVFAVVLLKSLPSLEVSAETKGAGKTGDLGHDIPCGHGPPLRAGQRFGGERLGGGGRVTPVVLGGVVIIPWS